MNVVLFEPNHSGHRAVYLAHLIHGLRDLPVRMVLVTTRGARETEGYRTSLASLEKHFEIDDSLTPQTGRPIGIAAYTLRELSAAIRRHDAHHAYLPYGDGVGQVAGLRRALPGVGIPLGCPVEIILHHSQQAYAQPNLKHRASLALQRFAWKHTPFARIHHVDRLEFEWWRTHRLAPDRAVFIPDPVDAPPQMTHEQAIDKLGLDPGRRYLGTTGRIDTRKGCDLLIAAFMAADLPEDVSLLLVGRQSDEIRYLLNGKYAEALENGKIVAIDRFVEMVELHHALAAMRFVVTSHPRHVGISSIVIRAVACGRPVLGADYGWIDKMVRDFGFGLTCDVHDHAAFTRTLADSFDASTEWEMTPRVQRFVVFHAGQNFERCLTNHLRERLSEPIADQALDWDWVMRHDDAD